MPTLEKIDLTAPLNLPDRYCTRDLSGGPKSLLAGRPLAKGENVDQILEGLYKAGSAAPAPAPRTATQRYNSAAGKLQEIERRVSRLERSQIKYRDIWKAGKVYSLNDQVTHAGALWICRSQTPTTDRPGVSPSWRLQTKTRDR